MVRAQNRERILEASLQEFSTKGYDATTLDAVARQANVSRLTVLNGFNSKIGLFRSTINHFCREPLNPEPLDKLLSSTPSSQRLEALLMEFYKILSQHIHLLRIFYCEPNLRGAPALSNWNLYYDMELYLTQYLASCHTAHTAPAPETMGKMLLSTVTGMVLEQNLCEALWACTPTQLHRVSTQLKDVLQRQ